MNASSSYDPRAMPVTALRSEWGWFVALGISLVLLGMLAFGNVFAATVVSVVFVGVMMITGALLEVIQAFRVKSWGGFFLWLLAGIIYGMAGAIAIYNPLLAAAVLTLMLAFTLIASGIVRAVLGFRLRPQEGWGWMVTSGVITMIAGIIFAVGWPANTLFLLGIVLAIDLTFQGISSIAFGVALKATPAVESRKP